MATVDPIEAHLVSSFRPLPFQQLGEAIKFQEGQQQRALDQIDVIQDAIALRTLSNDPNVQRYIAEEREAVEARLGRPLSIEESRDFLEKLIGPAIENAAETFSFTNQEKVFRNIPDELLSGSGMVQKPEHPMLMTSFGEFDDPNTPDYSNIREQVEITDRNINDLQKQL